ncbi:MAG: cupin domain-containing protein [Candidatus Saccharicenans sp.]|nr:cupin domain-containing protein [Candidatus Saccharicenans sp.]MDH7492590.1 cupin domain-containing protein [Candidatus Saccharicenans sp.]
MIEKTYHFTRTSDKLIEKIIADDNLALNHMVLNQGQALPEHFSNSNVYMIVIRGTITLQLAEQPARSYPAGTIINIPYNIKMNVSNQATETLEFFVVKAPSPAFFEQKKT